MTSTMPPRLTEARVVGALPADGWFVEYREDDGTTFSSPLAAWAVHAYGSVADLVPLDVDRNGTTDDPRTCSNFVRIYRRDHESTP
ncbi:putative hypothetical protein [Streptomyces sp. NBRC 110611]|uniref:hypothetical protein n=1 Tax=Streptomyces sp. NBRC 110611 TaxID=1621259 RepID=UPI00083306E4|nr:hypothetical protein [Streptomyces sp. NBRC 110611]GAU67667.1 putative hypothetical protein [Streptomyces sp. NBRC 110611]